LTAWRSARHDHFRKLVRCESYAIEENLEWNFLLLKRAGTRVTGSTGVPLADDVRVRVLVGASRAAVLHRSPLIGSMAMSATGKHPTFQ